MKMWGKCFYWTRKIIKNQRKKAKCRTRKKERKEERKRERERSERMKKERERGEKEKVRRFETDWIKSNGETIKKKICKRNKDDERKYSSK